MTDRKLLELAAKAAGQPGGYVVQPLEGWGFWQLPGGGEWNPLDDDGDALRLAVKLGFTVRIKTNTHQKFTTVGWFRASQVGEPHRSDPYAATRRAIVRAAAEIGKEMS